MVIYDLNFCGPSLGPPEAKTPLIIDADRMVASAITFQRFEAVAGRNLQIGEFFGRMKLN